MTVLTVLGTRPEITKLSPVLPLLDAACTHVVVHTGQHYSFEMDAVFFHELALRAPDHLLHVGSAPHGEQTARMLSRLEPVLTAERPDVVLVQGDTNTTLCGALSAAKLGIPVVHLEAGARSFDRRMPEELNRIVVDHVAERLLAADEVALANLAREGLADRAEVIGSTAIDAVVRARPLAEASTVLERIGVEPGAFVVLTVHRAANTTPEVLPGLVRALGEIAATERIVFPIHPRTAAAIRDQGLALDSRIVGIEPLGYLDMIRLVSAARVLLTDSGGLQEEAAVLGTPTLVLRTETEWTYLVEAGVQRLVGHGYDAVRANLARWLSPDGVGELRRHRAPIRAGAAARAVAAVVALGDRGGR